MNRAQEKSQRLLQIEQLLWAHPEGLTRAEIARRLNVNRSTITKYLDKDHLPPSIYEDDLDGNKLKIDRSSDLTKASFSLHEVLAIHLATRLLATRTDKQNPHAASALRKLGKALQRLDQNVSSHLLRSADAMDEAAVYRDPVYLDVLQKLTEAWSSGHKLEVSHQMEDGRVFPYKFSPYLIEPYAVGQTAHVIGLREPPAAVRTFKIERLKAAEILPERYTIPADFDADALLRNAWGIWYTEKEPVEVVLRFHPRVAGRVQESRWQRGERTEVQADGSLLWRAAVAEPREMLPWIRGWGADVEVMEPAKLKENLIREVQKLAELYGVALTGPVVKQYYGHTKKGVDESEWQLLKDHLISTGNKAFELGQDAGIAELAQAAGYLHDIGKYADAFQARLRGSKRPVDHATAGAREIVRLFPDSPQREIAELLSYCIAGHHSGLPDYGSFGDVETDSTLLARREKKKLEEYSAYKDEIDGSLLQLHPPRLSVNRDHSGFCISFLTRMIFSTLVDADWLDTESYVQDGAKPRGKHATIEVLAEQFNRFLQTFANPQREIDRKRTETLNDCIQKASSEPGFFTLTVPTGGGKTFASMAFALNHAVKHGLKRIIYVIPFTSIIEQNAEKFREGLGALGQENVLEHHSNFDWEKLRQSSDDESNDAFEKLKLAAENWDIPIVVTTNVQFFESLYASKKSRARKLHNIAKSVVIFDEVQMLPREFIQPCLLAVQELVQNYGVSAVFCTATQPSLQRFFPDSTQFTELAANPQELFDFYRRIQVTDLGTQTDSEIIERLNSHQQALCIVNTRRHAKGLFDSLDGDGCFHLSTLMYPAHRKRILAEIRQRLVTGLPCRVVSTQVMEAGIDVDFPVGYRALAGLDSILQAGGRVNREMKQSRSELFVFDPQTEFIKRTPIFIKQTASVARSILREFANDPTTIEAISAYFDSLYTLHGERNFDARGILAHFDKGTGRPDFDFKTAAEKFRLIDDNSVSVIIPCEAAAQELLEELRYTPYPLPTLRKLQMYTVNIYEGEFEALQSKGVIQTISDLYHVLDSTYLNDYYKPQTGLVLPTNRGGEAVFVD
jgi:CRISPR-associated endonuclease/helicase Cas3